MAVAAERGVKPVSVLPRDREGRARAWWFARSWIPVFALAAIALAPPGTSLRSTYALRWLAAALVLLAAVGRKNRRAAIATAVIAAAGALYVAGDSIVRVAGGAGAPRLVYVAGGLLVVAVSAAALARRPRGAFDPVRMVALQLAIGLVAYWLYYALSGLGLDYRTYQPETALRTAGTELGLLALAFAAVGVGISRRWRAAAERLGWARPEPWQVALAVVLALLLGLSNVPLNALMAWLMPGAEASIALVAHHVFGGVPAWSLPLIAVMAGVGEETAFRGALQPRFGIVATAVLFALIHVQYGVTPVELWVFVHALIYGLVRRHINTTTAILTHATYDLSAFLNGTGFGVYALIGLGMAIYLAGFAARDPDRVRRAVRAIRAA